MNGRQMWIDVAKGVLILLVVVGHSVGTGFHLPGPKWACELFQGIYKVIYTFHMPAFFVLAGVTWSAGKSGFGGYVRKKAFRLLTPYYAFGLVFVMLGFFVGGVAASNDGYYGGDVNSNLNVFVDFLLGGACPLNSPLWFLPCLFVVELLYYPLGRWIKIHVAGNAIPLVLWFLGYFSFQLEVNLVPEWIRLVPMYMGFMAIGHLFVPRTGIVPVDCLSRWMDGMLVVGVIVYAILGYYIPWLWESPSHYVLHVLLAIVGTLLTFCLAQRVQSGVLVACGSASVGIMVLHKLPISAILLKAPLQGAFRLGVWTLLSNLLVIGLSVALSLAGVWVVRRFMPWTLGEKGK